VTGRAARLLPFSIEPVVEHVVSAVDLRLRYGKSLARGNGDPLVYMTQRKRLDHFLVQKAVEAGADFREGVKVSALEMRDSGISVEGIEADVLIGADGVNGITARTLGIGGNRVVGVALEGNMPYAKMDRSAYDGRLALELGVVPGGYGWVFPKGDHANLGVGGWGTEGPRLRDHLDRLARAHGLSLDALTELRGHRLPMRRLGTPAAKGPVLLVGDAAGLVDPLSGDGMYEAFVSARLAADAVLTGDLEGYTSALSAVLDRHAAASWAAKRAFDRYPRTVFAAARAPGVFKVVAGLLCGDVAHPADAHGVARGPLKLIARLAG